jgi:hypothetical protein
MSPGKDSGSHMARAFLQTLPLRNDFVSRQQTPRVGLGPRRPVRIIHLRIRLGVVVELYL